MDRNDILNKARNEVKSMSADALLDMQDSFGWMVDNMWNNNGPETARFFESLMVVITEELNDREDAGIS